MERKVTEILLKDSNEWFEMINFTELICLKENRIMIINGIFGIGGPEIAIIMIVILLLFGAKKIPELMKGLGKGVRSFKEGLNDIAESPAQEEKDEGKQ